QTFEESSAIGSVASVSLPTILESFFPPNTVNMSRVQFHFYGTESLFEDPNSSLTLNSYVVSASVTNATVNDLKDPVVLTLRHLQPKELQDHSEVQCVYWDFQKNGLGGWDSNGCHLKHTNATHTTCHCFHLTHFGVLLDISKTPINPKDDMILTVITYVGCGVSSVFLGITLLTYLAFKLRRDYPSKILLNLSGALLGLNMCFLANSWLAGFNSYGLCITVAAVLHYFLLATFCWMGLEAVNMYLAFIKVFNVYVPSYILKFCILGWSCWVQNDTAFFVTVVGFVVLILVCNICVFIMVLVQIRGLQLSKAVGRSGGALHDLRVVASLTFLLGLTWILAFFAWGPVRVPLLYIFSALNSLQFFIFVFHCLMKENVRKQWRIHLCCGKFKLAGYSG
uniref:Adhesion G protein-coupled receptor G4b n=1 Tax=Astyanax mexicanus TaxID=7994 RepID=W5LKY6_ASTMX